jgi:hypothetical protein
MNGGAVAKEEDAEVTPTLLPKLIHLLGSGFKTEKLLIVFR